MRGLGYIPDPRWLENDMKKFIAIVSGLLCVASFALARPQTKKLDVALSGAGVVAGTATINNLDGWIEEIVVTCSDNASTGVVAVTVAPGDYTNSAVSLATGTATAEKRWRPRVDSTTVAGADNTGDAPVRFIIKDETISFAISASESSNVTWRCRIKYDDGK
jgi:hypothetical protein